MTVKALSLASSRRRRRAAARCRPRRASGRRAMARDLGEQGHQHQERGEQLGPADDVAHRLGVARMDGEQRRGDRGGEARAEQLAASASTASVTRACRRMLTRWKPKGSVLTWSIGHVGEHRHRPIERAGVVHGVQERRPAVLGGGRVVADDVGSSNANPLDRYSGRARSRGWSRAPAAAPLREE